MQDARRLDEVRDLCVAASGEREAGLWGKRAARTDVAIVVVVAVVVGLDGARGRERLGAAV